MLSYWREQAETYSDPSRPGLVLQKFKELCGKNHFLPNCGVTKSEADAGHDSVQPTKRAKRVLRNHVLNYANRVFGDQQESLCDIGWHRPQVINDEGTRMVVLGFAQPEDSHSWDLYAEAFNKHIVGPSVSKSVPPAVPASKSTPVSESVAPAVDTSKSRPRRPMSMLDLVESHERGAKRRRDDEPPFRDSARVIAWRTRTATIAKKAGPAPKTADPVPKKACLAPMKAAPAPKMALPAHVPKKAVPVLKKAAPVPKKAAAAAGPHWCDTFTLGNSPNDEH